MPPTKKSTSDTVYQFKVTLIDSKPPIWRRVQVPASVTMRQPVAEVVLVGQRFALAHGQVAQRGRRIVGEHQLGLGMAVPCAAVGEHVQMGVGPAHRRLHHCVQAGTTQSGSRKYLMPSRTYGIRSSQFAATR